MAKKVAITLALGVLALTSVPARSQVSTMATQDHLQTCQKQLEVADKQLQGTHQACDKNMRDMAVQYDATQQQYARTSQENFRMQKVIDYYEEWFGRKAKAEAATPPSAGAASKAE